MVPSSSVARKGWMPGVGNIVEVHRYLYRGKSEFSMAICPGRDVPDGELCCWALFMRAIVLCQGESGSGASLGACDRPRSFDRDRSRRLVGCLTGCGFARGPPNRLGGESSEACVNGSVGGSMGWWFDCVSWRVNAMIQQSGAGSE